MTASARDELRLHLLSRVPSWYSPWGHLLGPSLVGMAIMAGCISAMRDVRGWQLAFVPLFFFVSNGVEWAVHKNVLHRRLRPLEVLFVRHTPQHHAVFVADDMAIRSARELKLVLLPAYGVLTIFAATAPLGLLFALAGQRNLALLWVVVAVGYVLAYEWLHLSYHLPDRSFIGRLPIVRVLKRHHQLHHAPPLMQRWNFNVTLPIWDWLRGTVWRGGAAAAARVTPNPQEL